MQLRYSPNTRIFFTQFFCMSYVRRRRSVHFHINGYRIRKDAFWRWLGMSSIIIVFILAGAAWTFYSKDAVIHQATARFFEMLFQ